MLQSTNVKAALYMAVAMAAFSCGDAISKSLRPAMNAGEIIFVRGLFTSTFIGLLAWKLNALRSWRAVLQPMIVLRVVCEALASFTYMTALGMMPIANAAAILQALPLAVTLGAALFLREPVGWRRWTAIIVGFVGVLIIIRPGPEGFTASALLVVASMFATAARDLATRCIGKDVPSLTVTACTAMSMTVFGAACIGPLGGWQHVSMTSLSHIALGAVLVLVGYQAMILAMRTGEISFVAPFRYLSLIFSALLGLAIFGEIPDIWTLAGSGIVIASGLYAFYRENRRRRAMILATRYPARSAG